MADLRDIVAGMQVLGSDGGMVGRVTELHEGHIHVEPDAPKPGPGYFVVPRGWVARVDDHVHLDREAALVRDTWQQESPVSGGPTAGRSAATEPGVGRSWWVWAIGLVLLLLVAYLGIRGCDYASREPNYEAGANGTVDAPGT
jgi:hypothetical protein